MAGKEMRIRRIHSGDRHSRDDPSSIASIGEAGATTARFLQHRVFANARSGHPITSIIRRRAGKGERIDEKEGTGP